MSLLGKEGFLLLNGLAPRDRRAILLGVAVLVPALLYVFAVRPYRAAMSDVRDRIAAEQELLARELSLLETAPDMSEAIRHAQAEAQRYDDRMVSAANGPLAEGELSDYLEGWAGGNRVLLEEIGSGELERGEVPPPGLSVVRLHVRGESDLEGVLGFLREIEGSRLLLRVKGVALEPEVARPESGGRGEDPGAAVPTGVVRFQLIVDGFARLEEATGSPVELALDGSDGKEETS